VRAAALAAGSVLALIQLDEIWSFVFSKQRNVPEEHQDTFGFGDVWTWVAIDADTKLVPSFLVGERTLQLPSPNSCSTASAPRCAAQIAIGSRSSRQIPHRDAR
jgi:hypothetical protein